MLSPHFNHLIFKVLGFVLLALVSACGGGGGGGSTSRFEQILWGAGAVAAVKDNTTGLVWASQPAVNEQSPGSSPTVQELLTLTDAGKNAIAENFPLFLNQEIQSNEFKTILGDSTYILPWLVSFSLSNLGEVRDGEPLNGSPFSNLRVLDRRGKIAQPEFVRTTEEPAVVYQGDLIWQLCTYGSELINGECTGEPRALGFNAAKDIALQLSNEGYAGYRGWRLPTKQELQKMLNMGNANDSLLTDPFSVVERVNLINWLARGDTSLEYWTSTEAPLENPDPTDPVVWTVNFDFAQDSGGVSPKHVRANFFLHTALVRLVRNR